jgi:hypothetical protein
METRAVPHHAWTHVAAQTWLTLVITLTLALWHTGEAATPYSFIGFDAPLDGVTSTSITGVEYASGVVLGIYRDVYGNVHGWRGNKNTATMLPFQVFEGINRQKWTVGSFRPTPVPGAPPSDLQHGFLNTTTAMIPITVPDCTQVSARAVNDHGEVVGDCDGSAPAWHWKDGIVTLIEPQNDYSGCEGFGLYATGINNAGVIVGSCADTGFIYDHGVYTLFNGSIGQSPQAYIYPQGINDKGTVFGRACDELLGELFPPARCAGFILRAGVMSFVVYPGADESYITAVNPANGRIWGNWRDSAGGLHAFTATPKPGSARTSEEVASR